MKRCNKCHKRIWFWQPHFYTVKNILSNDKLREEFHYHSKCKQFGEIEKQEK